MALRRAMRFCPGRPSGLLIALIRGRGHRSHVFTDSERPYDGICFSTPAIVARPWLIFAMNESWAGMK